jgi:hypothetical protein
MNTKQTLLMAGAVSAIVLSAPLANAVVLPSLIVTEPTGIVNVQQALPCGEDLRTTRRIVGGRIEVTPVSLRERVQFDLTRLDLFLAPFSVRRECQGIRATAAFSEIGVRLASTVSFTAVPVDTAETGQFRFTIPKDQFLIFESVLDNAPFRQPETMYLRPSEDVTGLIDLRNRLVEFHVSLTSQLHFRAGCVGDRCVIDEVKDGTQTAEVRGRITPPTLDRDGDGVPDVVDNCPLTANPSHAPVATPVMTPPSDVTLHSCLDHTIGRATAADICNARPVLITNNAPARFAPGLNLVTWFANDGVDPIVPAVQRVTIQDTTAPTVSCTAVNPDAGRFQVAAADDCTVRITPTLGSYTLANDEVIQIQETGEPGVRLVGRVGADGIRHFLVGRGEGLIMATDAAGHVASAVCQRSRAQR